MEEWRGRKGRGEKNGRKGKSMQKEELGGGEANFV